MRVAQMSTLLNKCYLVKVSTKVGGGVRNAPNSVYVVCTQPLGGHHFDDRTITVAQNLWLFAPRSGDSATIQSMYLSGIHLLLSFLVNFANGFLLVRKAEINLDEQTKQTTSIQRFILRYNQELLHRCVS